jgi:hypothetical protein
VLPPSETDPPPISPVLGLTVSDELASLPFVTTPLAITGLP